MEHLLCYRIHSNRDSFYFLLQQTHSNTEASCLLFVLLL